jgi:adenine-specific DNA-methyltransferase
MKNEDPMKKLTAADPETKSPDLVAENLERLKALFPELVTEGPDGAAVNVDVLKALVGDKTVTDADEKYGLNWHGKRRARQLALTPSTGTLRPCPEDSVDWDTTQNLMIEGDNLEVLKLLQKSYAGKVKLIYIDPPYNTGKDFVYPDDFKDNIKNYLELTGQVESGRRISSNTEASGRFHTDWLNMMYPRLKLARNLLRDDGVFLASIDDNEVHHLIDLLNDVFGEECFVATLVWEKKKKGAFLSGDSTNIKEYVVVFAKSKSSFGGLIGEIARGTETYPVIKTTNSRGRRVIRKGISSKFREKNHRVDAGSRISSGNMEMILHSDLIIKDGVLSEDVDVESNWIYSQELLNQYADNHELYVTQDLYFRRIVNEPRVKRLKDVLPMEGTSGETGFAFRFSDNLFEDGWGTNEDGFDELHDLFKAQNLLSFPKPSKLLSKLVLAATREDKNALILDFFAGSGTTAHSVWALNAQDQGVRRVAVVQLPEPLDPQDDTQSAAAAYCDKIGKSRTIAELTKERLRRAAKKIKEANQQFVGDLGFRVFKLDSSNIREWAPDRDDLDRTLLDQQEHLKADRTEADILYELLLKLGLDICVPIETKTIAGRTVHSIGGGVLLACLATRITRDAAEPLAQGVVAWHQALAPAGDTTCVFRDSAFADDVAKTNLAAILNQHGLTNVRSL